MINKITYYIVLILSLLFSWECYAQERDFEKEFEAFRDKQEQEFDDFKNKADAEFEIFLKETWSHFNTLPPETAPIRPEPVIQPVVDISAPPLPPVEIKPVPPPMVEVPIPGKYIPGMPYTPMVVEPPVVPTPAILIDRMPVHFYGMQIPVAVQVAQDVRLKGNRETDVAKAWSKLCKADYEQLINDCMTQRDQLKMNDWAYVLFTKKIAEQVYGASQTEDIAFLQMFILCKSGYRARLALVNDKLKLMVAPAGKLFEMPFVEMDDARYYLIDLEKGHGATSLYTYKQNFAGALNHVSLSLNEIPNFAMQPVEKEMTSPAGVVKMKSVVNENLMNFYKDYPQCDISVYYHAPMSQELKEAMYPALKAAIAGKSQEKAANILIEFVQSGFKYLTDGEQFGFEKPFFIDENFYYPACDCEDRSILYATLVKDLLGLDVVLLDYPNHIATGVRFTDSVRGDYVTLNDGQKFLICDPTYIGATIGMCMPNYKKVLPEIIR